MFETATAVVVFLFGLAIGSFLNVCIRRIPRVSTDEVSLLRGCALQLAAITAPPSACPGCGTRIKPYDNIPVVSYVLLRGRCRACRAPISPVYPLVELLTGLLFLACYRSFGLTAAGAKWALFSALIVVLVFTDIFDRILPDLVNLSGLAAGLLFSLWVAVGDGAARWLSMRWFSYPPPDSVLSLADALLGAALGSGLLWTVAEGYFRIRGREGMGLGDVKMMAMAGAFLGPKLTLLTILCGSLLGSVAGGVFILLLRKRGDYELPFGVFLGVGALVAAFFGDAILSWYASLFS